MSFIYHAPLSFVIPAEANLRISFTGSPGLLLRYEEEFSYWDNAQRESCSDDRLIVESAWRGGTPLDPKLWTATDVGPAPKSDHCRFERVRLARIGFAAATFTARLSETPDSSDHALLNAFLEQRTVQLDVRLGKGVVAPVILRVGVLITTPC